MPHAVSHVVSLVNNLSGVCDTWLQHPRKRERNVSSRNQTLVSFLKRCWTNHVSSFSQFTVSYGFAMMTMITSVDLPHMTSCINGIIQRRLNLYSVDDVDMIPILLMAIKIITQRKSLTQKKNKHKVVREREKERENISRLIIWRNAFSSYHNPPPLLDYVTLQSMFQDEEEKSTDWNTWVTSQEDHHLYHDRKGMIRWWWESEEEKACIKLINKVCTAPSDFTSCPSHVCSKTLSHTPNNLIIGIQDTHLNHHDVSHISITKMMSMGGTPSWVEWWLKI